MLRSEMVKVHAVMKSIEIMDLDLVLIWIYILATEEDESLSLKGDPRVIQSAF